MPQSSIVFDPEISERDLDREVDQVNEQLADAATDIPVEMDAGGMDALTPAGAGGDDGGLGPGGAAGIGSLASKIPKSVSAVTASAALPIAIAGGVGVGMLSAMQSSSARLQTSTSLIRQAWTTVWRPLGDRLDQLFIRDLAKDILDATRSFESAFRAGNETSAAANLGIDLLSAIQTRNPASVFNIGTAILRQLQGINFNAHIPEWPGWPKVGELWPGWPDVTGLWPGWPSINAEWPGWPDIQVQWPGWPDIGTPDWPSTGQILGKFPTLSVSQLRQEILGGGRGQGQTPATGGGGGNDDNDIFGIDIPGLQRGGRVRRGGVARVHRGELVADPDRLVSELASAVSQAGGGTTNVSMDTREMERKLDELNRNVQRLARELNVSFSIGEETVGRVATNGKRERVTDTDPTV